MNDVRSTLRAFAFGFALASIATVAIPFAFALTYVLGRFFAEVLGWS